MLVKELWYANCCEVAASCYWGVPPFAFKTPVSHHGIDSTRCWKHHSEMLVHNDMIASHLMETLAFQNARLVLSMRSCCSSKNCDPTISVLQQ